VGLAWLRGRVRATAGRELEGERARGLVTWSEA
jgi:hypothetical protein